MRFRFIAAVLFGVAVAAAQSPEVQCDSSGGGPYVRNNGITERVRDVLFQCRSLGIGTVTADLTLSFNFPVTSRSYNPGSEIALVFDELSTPPLRVVQASSVVGNTVTFRSLTFPLVASPGAFTMRLVNVRGDMTGLAVQSTAKMTASATGNLFLLYPDQDVGYVDSPVTSRVLLPDSGSVAPSCSGNNVSLATSPTATGGTVDFGLEIKRRYDGAVKLRYKDPVQRLPTSEWFSTSESGFFDPSLSSANGLDKLGLADTATHIVFNFSEVPAGARVYVTTGSLSTALAQPLRLLSGGGTPALPTAMAGWNGSTLGIAPVPLANGAGSVEFEITALQDTYQIGVLVAFPGGVTSSVRPKVSFGLGPVGGSQIPRFLPPSIIHSLPVGPCVPGTDLMITDVSGPGYTSLGRSEEFRIGVVNRGTSSSGPFSYTIQVTDASKAERLKLTGSLPGLQGGEGTVIKRYVRLPLKGLGGGIMTMRVSADPVSDIDRSNNMWEVSPYYGICFATPQGDLVLPQVAPGYLPLKQFDFHDDGANCSQPQVVSRSGWPESGESFYGRPFVLHSPNNIGNTRIGYVCTRTSFGYEACQSVMQTYADQDCQMDLTGGPLSTVSPTGDTRTYTFTAQPTCKWTAAADSRNVGVDSGVYTGTQSITAKVRPNFTSKPRLLDFKAGFKTVLLYQAANPRTLNERLVQFAYYNFLGRLPSESEVSAQAAVLNNMDFEESVLRFFNALEFDAKSRYIAGLYVGILARRAEFNGFLHQRSALQAGIVNTTQLVDNFLNSPEFKLRFGTPDNANYVKLLYNNILLREPAQSEINLQVAALTGNPPTSRTQLASNFLNSPEFRISTGPNLTAFLVYACALGRDAVGTEFDTMLNKIKAGMSATDALQQLIGSPEFSVLVQ